MYAKLRQTVSSTQVPRNVLRGALLVALVLSLFFTAAPSALAQSTFKLLHTFSGPDGASPSGDLVRDSAGNIYGVTKRGGLPCTHGGNGGCGTLFRITAAGAFSVLHAFTGGADGEFPVGGLTVDNDAVFGTTAGDLIYHTCGGHSAPGSCGSIFELTKTGTFVVLHDFDGLTVGEAEPMGPVSLDASGNIYGTTIGTVFKLDRVGGLTVLHTFLGPKTGDGSLPEGRLMIDTAGNIFGTTVLGGTGCVVTGGCGTVFKIDPSGVETILSNFTWKTGWEVGPALVRDPAGNFFATTFEFASGWGSVFELSTAGVKTVLHNFPHSFAGHDGIYPQGLVRDAAGNLYGSTQSGGLYGPGSVFKINTAGKEKVLYSFTGGADGAGPAGSVILDGAGNLYGTCSQTSNPAMPGTVFELTLP